MRYEHARQCIRTGDLIAVKRRSGPLAIATRIITASDYTHTGVAIWLQGRLLMAHINGGGASLVPVSQELEFGFDVFRCPVNPLTVYRIIFRLLGKRISYSFYQLYRILLFIKLGIPLPKQGKDYICSALSAHIYLTAGWKPSNLPSIPWPAAIAYAIADKPAVVVDAQT